MKIAIFLFFVLVLSGLLIVSNNNLALHDEDNLHTFSELYVSWLNNVYSNVQTLTGQAVKLDWLPDEKQNP